MDSVGIWTGRTACALQAALRLTKEEFAERTGIGLRTIGDWHQQPDIQPKAATQQILDTLLEQVSEADRSRFAQLAGLAEPARREVGQVDAERRLSEDPHIGDLLESLDRYAGWTPGTARRNVVERISVIDVWELNERRRSRVQVKQTQVAHALSAYYGTYPGYGTYRGRCGDDSFDTTIVTRPDWLDLQAKLTLDADRLRLTSVSADERSFRLDEFAANHAVSRLAEAVALETRIYDLPLYRLLAIDVRPGIVGGTLTMASFVEFALTLDMLEGEIVDAIAAGRSTTPGNLPLRDRYLPDMAAVVNISNRLCAGGALALFAVARPASVYHPKDYLILVQERSGHVVNSARRLSVTQGFHQPMIDYRVETRIALTLMRELEEEMFGREELDNTVSQHRGADPMHPTRLTRPMRWLTKDPDRMRIEATGFGLNLVNGNYEFANLIVVEDERFWDRFGGHVEANWEAGCVRRYSSQDQELIADLIADPAWTNEGLFTLLQGLRRLARLDPERVNLPTIEWTLD